jgi:site-specific DNA-methyltransferase (adenine-specific)
MLEVECGDMRQVLQTLPENAFHACVTDPPYELGFMGKAWDKSGVAFDPETWRAAWRVLRPGAHLLAFGGTRTFHRIACAIEDAGFEVRDSIAWLYGQGFPKSLDLAKAIDKAAGAERQVVGERRLTGNAGVPTKLKGGTYSVGAGLVADVTIPITAPATELAKAWDGWGTALKPSFEPIVVARKPLEGTVAANVEAWGVGGLHIDACRTPAEKQTGWGGGGSHLFDGGLSPPVGERRPVDGRWPPNVCVDDDVAADLDHTYGVHKGMSGGGVHRPDYQGGMFGKIDSTAQSAQRPRKGKAGSGWGMTHTGTEYPDSGGVSRYFYCAKANSKERDAGLDAWPVLSGAQATDSEEGQARLASPRTGAGRGGGRRNPHPTVKPLELMRWLVRLVTPPGGFVLDPFAGSGTTGCAAAIEGFHFAGIELDPTHTRLAMDRIAYWAGTRSNSVARV